MKLSTRARYALRMMVEIARRPGSDLVSIGDVAAKTRISRRYLDQLALALKTHSLMRAMRGRGGGYQLARPAEEISVGQIIEAAIGPINVVECVQHPDSCLQSDYCECRWLYKRINDGIVKLLNEISLAELAHFGGDAQDGKGPLVSSGRSGCPMT